MNIYDYIPNYPTLTDDEFNEKIYHKKEFYDLRSSGNPGEQWNHQTLLKRFMSPHTSYNEMLLFHTPGTGKTCAAIAVAEANKLDPAVHKPILIIVPNENLKNQWERQIALVCTRGPYIPEGYFSENPDEKLTAGEKKIRMRKLINSTYKIITMERMRIDIDRFPQPGGDKILNEKFSNRIIIIDEAHNLRIQAESKTGAKNTRGRYNAFHRFLHVVDNCKILLLSGTPMFDKIGELPAIVNLILPIDQQLPTGKKFSARHIKVKNGVKTLVNTSEIAEKLTGRVSYIREGGSFPMRVDMGKNRWTRFLKTVDMKMSTVQAAGYEKAYTQDTVASETRIGLWKNSRQAASFVYKKDDEYLWGKPAFDLLVEKTKPRFVRVGGKRRAETYYQIKQDYRKDLTENLEIYSKKYKYIIDYVLAHPTEPIFIFTPIVSGTGGAIFLGLLLGMIAGYSRSTHEETIPAKRYAIITGGDNSDAQRRDLIATFNSPQNRDGSLIAVVIATKAISEGTSFINVRHEIVVSPYWNNSGTDQAIGRGLRADSLAGLPREERKVTVQQLASYVAGTEPDTNIDVYMYRMSESKDYEIKNAERFLKRVAWDCPFNYDRNVRETDMPNTRNCEYTKCNYKCKGITPDKTGDKWSYDLPQDELDDTTYLLYYSEADMLRMVGRIKLVMQKYSMVDLRELEKYTKNERFELLLMAVEYAIENNVSILNKWGQPCFLRSHGDLLFLSDTLKKGDVLNSWYVRHPYVNKITGLSDIINDEIMGSDLDNVDNLNCRGNKDTLQNEIEKLSLETRMLILETAIRQKEVNLPLVRDLFLSTIYKNHVFEKDDIIMHDMQKIKLDGKFIDFARGKYGALRCYQDEKWGDCTSSQEISIKDVARGRKDDKQVEIESKHDIYGIVTTDNKFQIVDKTQQGEDAKSDLRRVYKGRVCNTWTKERLMELIVLLGIDPPSSGKSLETKEQYEEFFSKTPYLVRLSQGKTLDEMRKIYDASIMTNAKRCDLIKEWFDNNDRLVERAV